MAKKKKGQPKPPPDRTRLGKDLEKLVGREVYSTWIQMLKQLVPTGRTERLSVLVAAMLQFAAQSTAKDRKSNPAWKCLRDGSYDPALDSDEDEWDEERRPEGDGEALLPLIQALFKEAGVRWKRTNARGQSYSIAEAAADQFQRWDFMPWE